MTYVYELMLHSVIAGYLRDPLNSTSMLTDLGWPKNVSTLSLRLIINHTNIASNAAAHRHLMHVIKKMAIIQRKNSGITQPLGMAETITVSSLIKCASYGFLSVG